MNSIALDTISVDENTVRYEFTHPSGLRRFFSGEDLLVEYDVSMEDVPDGILAVVWLSNVCPIAWATGTDVRVPRLDTTFARAIPRVGRAFEEMYPDLVNESTITVAEAETTAHRPGESNRSAMLFSGGVDSVATYYRHRDEAPLLISVHGHDVSLADTDGWAKRREIIEGFATARALDTRYVSANIGSFQEPFLLYAHFGSGLYSDWIDAVHLGLGLTGLCAPLTYTEDIGRLYVADSIHRLHVESAVDEVANHPSVIREIAWDGTRVENDGYPLTRQEKIDLIAEELGDDPLELHVCLESATTNCSRCEKCLRTALPLVLAGLDPNDYGFDIDADSFAYAREQFESGSWRIDAGRIPSWVDIQNAARRRKDTVEFDSPEAEAFFEWIATVDVDEFEESQRQVGRRLLRTAARNTPYPVYQRAKNADRVVSLATKLLNR